MKLVVMYSCKQCGAERECVPVRFRYDSEDGIFYVKEVIGFAVGRAHSTAHPQCTAQSISDLRIPAPNDAKYLGDPNATYGEGQTCET